MVVTTDHVHRLTNLTRWVWRDKATIWAPLNTDTTTTTEAEVTEEVAGVGVEVHYEIPLMESIVLPFNHEYKT